MMTMTREAKKGREGGRGMILRGTLAKSNTRYPQTRNTGTKKTPGSFTPQPPNHIHTKGRVTSQSLPLLGVAHKFSPAAVRSPLFYLFFNSKTHP